MAQTLQLLRHAVLALREEVLGFRFDYPLEIVSQAGPKESLEYYLYSDRLSWDVMRLDEVGIPRVWRRKVYRPDSLPGGGSSIWDIIFDTGTRLA